MNSSNHITPPENCTGCGLCANVCAKDAIHMVWSKNGFLVPEVDTKKCVHCGLCVKQCIALEDNSEYTDNISSVVAYGGWNKNEETHLLSSSGGIFTALAEHIIQQEGVVFGVVWKDKLTAVFDKAETVEELSRMRGSKYTPAVPGGVYRDVKKELQKGRQVLFSGTPCQVHALKKYLRKTYDNLLTVDIVCHGVPSHLILEKYIVEDETRTNKTINHISFRDKPEGWQHFHVTRHYTDGSKASEALNSDIYMRMFLCDKALNLACYYCTYAHIPRQGDITLGDYWGVENYHSGWPIDKGISAILANTERGNNVLHSLEKNVVLKTTNYLNMLPSQGGFKRHSNKISADRLFVLNLLREKELRLIQQQVLNVIKLGPIYLKTNGIIYKTLRFSLRFLRYIKQKIISRS